eukprot:1150927-Pelagomonas_calceolata.AAC.7
MMIGFPLEVCNWRGVCMRYSILIYQEYLVIAWYRAQWFDEARAVCPHDLTGNMSLLWGQIVQFFPSMGDMLVKNTLQVVHVDLGSGARQRVLTWSFWGANGISQEISGVSTYGMRRKP